MAVTVSLECLGIEPGSIAEWFIVRGVLFFIFLPNLFVLLKALVTRGHDMGLSARVAMPVFLVSMLVIVDFYIDFKTCFGELIALLLLSISYAAVVAIPVVAMSVDSQVGENRYGLSDKYPFEYNCVEIDRMSCWRCFCRGLSREIRWTGRATRKEFWSFHLFALLFFIIVCTFPMGAAGGSWYETEESWRVITWALGLYGAYSSLKMHVARMHDVGWKAYLAPISFPLLVGKMLISGWFDSQHGSNEWGASLKYPDAVQAAAQPDAPEAVWDDVLDEADVPDTESDVSDDPAFVQSDEEELIEMLEDDEISPLDDTVTLGRDISPLAVAVMDGDVNLCEALIRAGADVNGGVRTPLHAAALTGNIMICDLLIRNHASINACDDKGYTPLHYAAWRGLAETCEFLIDHGADVNARAESDEAPLDRAAKCGKTEACRVLIAHGARLGGMHGYTPLHWAASEGYADTCRLLIDAGADLDARFSIIRAEDAADLEAGFTPLEIAALSGYVDICKMLIDAGADVMGDDTGTPLHCGATGGRADVCRLLISAGADVNARDSKNRTPLHLATMRGNDDVCRVLRDAGADAMDMPDEQDSVSGRGSMYEM